MEHEIMKFNRCRMRVVVFEINAECYFYKKKKIFVNDFYKRMHAERYFQAKHAKRELPYQLRQEKDADDIIYELSRGKFYGCSCIIIFFNFACSCSIKIYSQMCKAISENRNIKYLTKFVITRNYSTKLREALMCIEKEKRKKEGYNKKLVFHKSVKVDNHALYDKEDRRVNNIIHFHVEEEHESHTKKLCRKLLSTKQRAIQEVTDALIVHKNPYLSKNILSKYLTKDVFYTKILTSPNDGCYLFQINPSMAIILNHYNVKGHKIREGSEFDLNNLKKTFRRKNIPYLVLPDGSAEEVQRIMSKTQTTSFGGVKQLFLFVMSHGEEEGQVLCTKTRPYNLKSDVIAPLLANESLAETEIYIIHQACRGELGSPVDSDPEDYVYKPTEDQIEERNLLLWFSTIRDHVAYRYRDSGSPVIQEFCKKFRKQYEDCSIEVMKDKIERHLLKNYEDYKDGWTKIMELIMAPNTNHTIRNQSVNRDNFKELIDEFCRFVKSEQGKEEKKEKKISRPLLSLFIE